MRFDRAIHDSAWSALDSSAIPLPQTEPLGRPHNGLEEMLETCGVSRAGEHLILEIGCELGGSTRFFLQFLRNSSIVCVDPWPEGYKLPKEFHAVSSHLGTDSSLYKVFLHFCRCYRDRILPLREFSSVGIVQSYQMALVPDIVYIDGDHRYVGTLNDLILVHSLFPDALIIGDDWNFSSHYPIYKGIEKSVQKAAVDFAEHFGLALRNTANTYAVMPDPASQRAALNYTVPKKR